MQNELFGAHLSLDDRTDIMYDSITENIEVCKEMKEISLDLYFNFAIIEMMYLFTIPLGLQLDQFNTFVRLSKRQDITKSFAYILDRLIILIVTGWLIYAYVA